MSDIIKYLQGVAVKSQKSKQSKLRSVNITNEEVFSLDKIRYEVFLRLSEQVSKPWELTPRGLCKCIWLVDIVHRLKNRRTSK